MNICFLDLPRRAWSVPYTAYALIHIYVEGKYEEGWAGAKLLYAVGMS